MQAVSAAKASALLAERWYGFRDRLIASRRFQRWAARSPITRFVARRRASELFDLSAGFVYSQVVAACVELELLERLRDKPQTVAQLSSGGQLDDSALTSLLNAATALRLVRVVRSSRQQSPDQAFGLGDLGAALLGNPGVMALIKHHRHFYTDLTDPVDLLARGRSADATALRQFWPYSRTDDPRRLAVSDVTCYTDVMSSSQQMIADQVLAAYSLKPHRRILDVGGGNGEFIKAVAHATPAIGLSVFDLPAVAELAARHLASTSLGREVDVTGGSFLTDSLPTGADVISLIRIVHDHDDEHVLVLLKAVLDALPPGGTLLLAEPMASPAGTSRISDAYFTMYLHAMGSGKPRTEARLRQLLADSGFQGIREHATALPALVRVLTCQRPS